MTSITPAVLSCEFFPPRTELGLQNFRAAYQSLQALQPAFFSVTFGAGGSTRDATFDTVVEIQRGGQVPAAPHLSCVASSRDSLRQLLLDYQANGIRHLVALRGDRPSGSGGSQADELRYASELVAFIRQETGDHFKIEVAAYPEVHPQASSARSDLRYFKQKVEAGANSAITQYFYNADAYFHFVDKCQQQGIEIPIVPGIMPISNYAQLARFSETCGAEIPRWLLAQLQDFGDDSAAIQAFGIEVVSRLCRRLLEGGAPGLHFYTLNRADTVLEIVKTLA